MPFWRIGAAGIRHSRLDRAARAGRRAVADALIAEREAAWRWLILALLAIGRVTGLDGIARSPVLPPPLSSFYGAWAPDPPAPKLTSLAPFASLPAARHATRRGRAAE